MGDSLADVLNLLFQSGEVRRGNAMVFRDDHVAGAKQAKALTKRQMHINRNRGTCRLSLFVGPVEFVEAEVVTPDRRRRIAGIARSGPVIEGEKVRRNAKSLAFEVEVEPGIL